jgi:hypothetical protein
MAKIPARRQLERWSRLAQALIIITKSLPDRRLGYKGLSVTIITTPGCMLFLMTCWNARSALSLDTTDSSDRLPIKG